MKISVERIQDLIQQITDFNNLELSEIQLIENGIPIKITPEILDAWRFIGLSNKSFIEMEYWKEYE